ncbi:MAG: uroporphyrinogen-III C-methyltransferase [Flavobacteriales bacterium]|nr:uroporphyrinogen-III C-methyltransferase [Flavobacteriales bacterium]
MKNERNNKVIIAGAGPGDPELITLKTFRALENADVIITDRLVSPEIFSRFVSAKTEIIYAGKESRRVNSTSQISINAMLVEEWRKGKNVVRLKGGDVSIFSNILDELQTLTHNKIPYEIIPGVSAALGAAAYAGIPLTARNHATAVRFLTWYDESIITNETWKELAHTSDTLVFYMSGEKVRGVIEKLLSNNINPEIEVAVIEQATTPHQRITTFRISDATQRTNNEFISPALMIIGNVVSLHHEFNWFQTENEFSTYFINSTDNLKIKDHAIRA